MKNKVTLLVSLFISAFIIAKAQTVVPNANMELWTDHGNYDDPNFWATPNGATNLFSIWEVFKDSVTVNSGNYAARLENKNTLLGIVPGAMGTGVLDVFNQIFSGGFPLTDPNVAAMTGYYKYSPSGNDSAFMFALLFHWNTSTNKRDTVGAATYIGGPASTYTFFGVPFVVLIPGETPDSAMVIVSAAFDVANAHVGTILWVDDIDFTNSLGISPIQTVALNLYPNPADETGRITLPQELNAQSIIISNVEGKIVKEIKINSSSEIHISTTAFTQGNYVAFVKNKEGKIVASGKFTINH